MNTKEIEELQRKIDIFSTPLDVEKYIDEGLISRYKNTNPLKKTVMFQVV